VRFRRKGVTVAAAPGDRLSVGSAVVGVSGLSADPIPMPPPLLEPLGDRAFLAHFFTEAAAGAWAAAVRDLHWPGVTDVVLAYQTVAVFADPERVDLTDLESRLLLVIPSNEPRRAGQTLVIPVLYDGADLLDVATRLSLSPADVIALHCQIEYDVFAIGFLPGFPYAGYLAPALAGLARRDSPRVRVPAGSVAIAGRQTGIYPVDSPGGWHLLGTTPLCIADLESGYFPIRAGDRIRFEPISPAEFEGRRHQRLDAVSG
jgi:KipI family sensor histidine kinase inhibitor